MTAKRHRENPRIKRLLAFAEAPLLGLALVLAAASALFGSIYALGYRTPFPFRDMVEIMEFLDAGPAIWMGEGFTHLHDMEHRPALPAFIWYADRLSSGSDGLMPLIVSHAALGATAILATANWAPRISWSAPFTWVIPVAGVAAMFSLSNWYNLVWEKQLHVAMSLLFLTISAHFAAKLSCYSSANMSMTATRNLAIAIGAAWAAAFSFGYGLPALLVITIHAILARWRSNFIHVSATLSLALAATYLYFFSLGGRGPTAEANRPVLDTMEMVVYVARFLAGTVADLGLDSVLGLPGGTIPALIGTALLAIYAFRAGSLYAKSLRSKAPPVRAQSFSLIVVSTCVAIALMTAISRPLDTGGLVDRYYIVSTVFLLSLPGLFIPDKARTVAYARNLGFLMPSFVFISLSIFGHIANYPLVYLNWHFSAIAAIATDMGIYQDEKDAQIGPPIHQSRSKAMEVWERHRTRLLTRQQYRPFEWLGRSVTTVFDTRAGQECFGGIEKTSPVLGHDGKYAFVGWARHGQTAASNADWILATNSEGIVIGLGAPGRRSEEGRKWLNEYFPRSSGPFGGQSGVAGYVSSEPRTIVNFFMVTSDSACVFARIRMPDPNLSDAFEHE